MSSRSALSRWVEHLQSQGRYTFTRGEAEAKTDRTFVRPMSSGSATCSRRWASTGSPSPSPSGFVLAVLASFPCVPEALRKQRPIRDGA